MQISQRVDRNTGHPDCHVRAGPGIEHPLRHHPDDARFDLDMDHAAAGAPLPVLCPQTPPVERMPTVMDLNDLPEMGRMNRRW